MLLVYCQGKGKSEGWVEGRQAGGERKLLDGSGGGVKGGRAARGR